MTTQSIPNSMASAEQVSSSSASTATSSATPPSNGSGILQRFGASFHVLATIALTVGLAPAFKAVGLPLRFDWPVYFQRYWMSLALQSIFAAVLLYVIAFPVGDTLGPLWVRCRKQKLLIPLLLAPAILLIAFNGFWAGLVASINGIVLIEWFTPRLHRPIPIASRTGGI